MKWGRKMISEEMWIKIRSMFTKGVKVSDIQDNLIANGKTVYRAPFSTEREISAR
jgi:hypothetical protein